MIIVIAGYRLRNFIYGFECNLNIFLYNFVVVCIFLKNRSEILTPCNFSNK